MQLLQEHDSKTYGTKIVSRCGATEFRQQA